MGKFLKKNWFVVMIVIIFIGISTYYIYDTNKGKLKGKKTNGEDVVFSIDNSHTTSMTNSIVYLEKQPLQPFLNKR